MNLKNKKHEDIQIQNERQSVPNSLLNSRNSLNQNRMARKIYLDHFKYLMNWEIRLLSENASLKECRC